MQFHLDTVDLLGDVQVASPCSADWYGMSGDDRVRFCTQCQLNVYNLSTLTAEQAKALLREKEGRLCIRFYRRRDGTVLTADCPAALRHPWLWLAAFLTALLGVVLPGFGYGYRTQGVLVRRGHGVAADAATGPERGPSSSQGSESPPPKP